MLTPSKQKAKLPLVVPMLFYNGTKIYDALRNLWKLFEDPNMANYEIAFKRLGTKDRVKKCSLS